MAAGEAIDPTVGGPFGLYAGLFWADQEPAGHPNGKDNG